MSDTSGGFVVTKQMKDILKKPGYLSIAKGGQKLRELYVDNSSEFDPTKLSDFGMCCCLGILDAVQTHVKSGSAPDLKGTETPYKFGYATLIVAGAQRVGSGPPGSLKHVEVLKFLVSHGLPVDIEDIAGLTALFHAVGYTLKLELARVLLEAGADVNHQNRYGEVALFTAFQRNHVAGIDLLMEYGADLDIEEADHTTPRKFFLACGPQVTATVQKWIKKQSGQEAPRVEKKCDSCEKADVALKNCSRCQVARYCSVECQRKHWPTHKKLCQPFSSSNTVTLKPFYGSYGAVVPTSNLMRNSLGIPTGPTPESHGRAAHFPKTLSSESKNIIIKVQVPFNLETGGPAVSKGNLFIYTKKRDFVCTARWEDDRAAYDRISETVRSKGVGGAKAYFAAELRSKDELIVKVSEVLAEQPF